MRKIVILSVIAVLTASAGAYVYFYQPFARQTAMEAVLPGNTLAMVRICELKKQIERFNDGRMGRSLAGIDLQRLMAAMEVQPDQRLKITQGLETFKAATQSPWFDALFGQDISVAVLNISLDPQQFENNDLQPLLDAAVLVARPKQPTRVLESLSSMFATQISVQTQDYQQWRINQFALDNGKTVYYALNDGLIIAGLSALPVQRCLEQSLQPETSLLHAQTYQRHCAGMFKNGQTDLIAFAAAGRAIALLGEAVGRQAEKAPQMNLLKTQLEGMQGIETINLAKFDDGTPLVRSKMIVGIDRQQMSPGLTRALSIAPASNPTLKHAPADVLLYSWQNTFDLKLYWQQIQQHPGMTPESVAQIKQSFATKTGMQLEALLEAFGTQAGLLINDINMDGMFPIPELALFIEIKQPDRIDQLIKQQISQFNMPLQQEAYRGTDLQYVMLPAGANLSPAYAFSEGFCTLAINRTLLKSMLDAAETSHLGSHPDFKALGKGLTEKNNQVFYLHTEGMVAKVRELITWGMAWMAMAKPDGIDQAKQIVELGINPLLDGFSMIKAVGGRTCTEENQISSDIQMLLDRT